LVYTDRIADGNGLLVYTDKISDGIISVGKNYRLKNFVGNSVGFRRFSGNLVEKKDTNNCSPERFS
jgi:hypothetical protein